MSTGAFGPTVLALDIGEGELKVVAGSILASAVVVLIFVLREKKTVLRLTFGLIALGLVAWAIYLFAAADIERAKTAPEVTTCKRTLAETLALARTKLILVQNETEAKAIGQQMIDVIENSPCKP